MGFSGLGQDVYLPVLGVRLTYVNGLPHCSSLSTFRRRQQFSWAGSSQCVKSHALSTTISALRSMAHTF